MQDQKITDHQNPVGKNVGHEIEGPNFNTWKCTTWKWRTNLQDMKMQDIKLQDMKKAGQCWMQRHVRKHDFDRCNYYSKSRDMKNHVQAWCLSATIISLQFVNALHVRDSHVTSQPNSCTTTRDSTARHSSTASIDTRDRLRCRVLLARNQTQQDALDRVELGSVDERVAADVQKCDEQYGVVAVLSVLRHCWLRDRTGIRPNLAPAIAKVLLSETLEL